MCVMATNFLELATTLKYLGAKWLPGKKVNFTPWEVYEFIQNGAIYGQGHVTIYATSLRKLKFCLF